MELDASRREIDRAYDCTNHVQSEDDRSGEFGSDMEQSVHGVLTVVVVIDVGDRDDARSECTEWSVVDGSMDGRVSRVDDRSRMRKGLVCFECEMITLSSSVENVRISIASIDLQREREKCRELR